MKSKFYAALQALRRVSRGARYALAGNVMIEMTRDLI
jgi:hypothetical protein